jgi:hypothetical protein
MAGLLCAGVGVVSSCDDYLTLYPTNQISEEDFWQSEGDLDGVRAGAYGQLEASGTTGRILYWGEMRSDNVSLNDMTQQNIEHLQQGILMPTDDMFSWGNFYTGINYCNLVLEKGEEMTEPGNEVDPTFRRSDWKPIKAEMMALRALNYFYLVRAFRDVPYVTTAVRTDAEARARKDGATSGITILGHLITDLEDVLGSAADNFGSTSDNQARFTRRGIQALLADIYLWRGCLLKNNKYKGDVVINENGDTLTSDQCTTLSTECFNKSVTYCNDILTYVDSIYQDKVSRNNVSNAQTRTDLNYPYLTRHTINGSSLADNIYSGLWGPNVSTYYDSNDEIILNLVYDGTSVTNASIATYLSYYSNGVLTNGYMRSANMLTSSAKSSYEPDRGFGKTDIRLLETFAYSSSSTSAPMIHKNVMSSLTVENVEDMTEGGNYSYVTTRSQPWPLYRLTDIMLIKAEALARSVASTTQAVDPTASNNAGSDGAKVTEGFNLVNAIFERNNPKLSATGTDGAGELVSDRLLTNYAYKSGSVKTADDLLTLVLNERQREFVGEGKRWFDIVRQCESCYNGSNSDALSKYITLSTTVRNRLKSLYSLYNPINSDEIKINGVDYGGNLTQNPVWDRYTVK